MCCHCRWFPILMCVGFIGLPLARAQVSKEDILNNSLNDNRDLTLLKRISQRTFVHEPTGVAYTIPKGWEEIRPHRLAGNIDKRISTVLGIEDDNRKLVASLYWIQMTRRKPCPNSSAISRRPPRANTARNTRP